VSGLEQWLEADILSLGMAADEARQQGQTRAPVTYLRVHAMTAEQIAARLPVPDAAAEVRIHDLPSSLDDAVAQVRAVRARAGDRRVAAYSMADLETRAAEGWGELDAILKPLVAAGMSDVAELPVDQLQDVIVSIRALTAAGAAPRRITVSRPLGDRKIEILESVRRCRIGNGTPASFSPLPRHAPLDKPTTGYEDLRMVALARLALDEERASGPWSIEVDWSLYGPKLAQVALTFGADHLDAVPAESDPALGPRRATVEDIERNIRAAGFEPREVRPAR
jgi:hypothetical protein